MKQLLLAVLATASLYGATTTITQTVNLSNGNPANGTALIRITTPCTSGAVYVGQQTVAATFLGGAFSVSLTPNDTCVPAGTSYVVSWVLCGANSSATTAKPCPSGAAQSWSETWVVPTSANPVTVSAVLVSVAPAVVSASPLNVTYSQTLNGDVTGAMNRNVVGAIQGRPVTATPPTNGQLYQWSTTANEWVLVTLGSGGSGSMNFTGSLADGQYIRWNAGANAWQPVTFVDQETPAGTLDGTNTVFTLVNPPGPAAGLVLFRNGLVQMAGQDYTLSGSTVTFLTAATPQPGDTLLSWYRY